MALIHKKIEIWFGNFTAYVYRRKFSALTVMLLLTVSLAAQMPKLTIDTRDESFFHDNDPTLVAYNKFRDTFGQDDVFIIAMKPEKGLDLDFFPTLRALHNDLATLVPYLDDITSLVNARIVRAEGDTLIVEDLMAQFPESETDLKHVRNLIDRYPLYDRVLVSTDRSITSIIIKAQAVKPTPDGDLLAGFDQDEKQAAGAADTYLSNAENVEIAGVIDAVIAKYQGRGITFHFAGTPALVAALQKGIERDLSTMFPIAMGVMVLFLILLFRNISGVVFPLLTVVFSLVSSLGIMAMAGYPITNVTQILPTFLIVVGVGDSVHILTLFYRAHRELKNKQAAIVQAVKNAGLPVLMTSVTTACGLVSFAWADIGNIAQLGNIAPIGVMLAFIYTVILLPALIAVFPIKPPKRPSENYHPLADRIFDAISRITTRRPVLVALISAVIVAGAGVSMLSLHFSHNAVTWFPEGTPIREAMDFLDKINGGSIMLEVTVDTGRENGLHDPDMLRRLNEAATFLPRLAVNGITAAKAVSIADVLKEINRALHEDREAAYVVPDKRELIAQELILFEASGSDDLDDVTDSLFRTGRLSLLAPFKDAVLYKEYVDQVAAYLEKIFPTETVTLTGHIPLFIQIIKNFLTSMVKSYVFALLVITLLMVVMVGKIRIGLLSMVANVVPILLVFGVMGWYNIPLDMCTVLVGSVVLGLVVDDTIHFLHHFRRAYEETHDVEAAVRETLHTTGRALVITSLVLSSGFFIYTIGFLASSVRFGLLSGCAVVFALAADFFLIPALLRFAYGSKKTVPEAAREEIPCEG